MYDTIFKIYFLKQKQSMKTKENTRMKKDYLLRKWRLNRRMNSEVIAHLYNTIDMLREEVLELKKYKITQENNFKVARKNIDRIIRLRQANLASEKYDYDKAFWLITWTYKEEKTEANKEFSKEVEDTFERLFWRQTLSSNAITWN